MVDEDGVGFRFDGGVDQIEAGGHATDDVAHFLAPLDLQTVRPIILETRGIQRLVKKADDVFAVGHVMSEVVSFAQTLADFRSGLHGGPGCAVRAAGAQAAMG